MLSCSAASRDGETSSIGESWRSAGLPWLTVEPPGPLAWDPGWRPSLLLPRCSKIQVSQSQTMSTDTQHRCQSYTASLQQYFSREIRPFWCLQYLDSFDWWKENILQNRPSLDYCVPLQVKFEIIEFPTNKLVLQNLDHECGIVRS